MTWGSISSHRGVLLSLWDLSVSVRFLAFGLWSKEQRGSKPRVLEPTLKHLAWSTLTTLNCLELDSWLENVVFLYVRSKMKWWCTVSIVSAINVFLVTVCLPLQIKYYSFDEEKSKNGNRIIVLSQICYTVFPQSQCFEISALGWHFHIFEFQFILGIAPSDSVLTGFCLCIKGYVSLLCFLYVCPWTGFSVWPQGFSLCSSLLLPQEIFSRSCSPPHFELLFSCV